MIFNNFIAFIEQKQWRLRTASEKYRIFDKRLFRIQTMLSSQTLEKLSKKELIAIIEQLQQRVQAEEVIDALEQTNAALQDLFDNSNDLIFVCSIEGDFLFFNKTCKEKLRYGNEQLRSINIKALLHPQYKADTYQKITQIMAGEQVESVSTALLNSQGETIHLSGRISCRFDEQGRPLALRCIMYDTTERVRIEGELSSQSARLKAVFESGSHIMWTVNRQRHFTSFNQNYIKTLQIQYGITPRLNEDLADLKEALRKEGMDGLWQKHMKAAFEGKVQHFEIQVSDINGNPLWRDVFLNPIPDAEGNIKEVSAIAHDITENKKAEIALKASEQKFRSIFESFQDVYYQSDLKGNILMISPSIQEMGGYRPEEMLGKNVTEFYVHRRKAEIENALMLSKELLKVGKVKNFEIGLRHKSGRIIESISNVRLEYDEQGQPLRISGVIRDITELKRASTEALKAKELAEKLLKVKEGFLANMSHEIRTPMNGIIGMIELLTHTPLNPKQKDYVNTLRRSSATLMDILNDILDLSKVEAGKMQLHLQPIALTYTLDKIYHLFLPQASNKGNMLSYEIAPDVPEVVLADETRLIQVISNLTSNAIKFTEKGRVHIRLSLQEWRKDGKALLHIAVEDSGIGIARKDLKRLFNHFSQLDHSRTKTFSGTGLGLAISKQLAKRMGGSIGVDSVLGQGSSFWFSFEAAASTAPAQNLPSQEQAFSGKKFFGKKVPYILIIDDNAINRKVAQEILQMAGAKTALAGSAREGIAQIQAQTFDLVLMDIQMPEMDGIEATRLLKTMGLAKLPPIVAMTAYSMQDDQARLLEEGLDGYIAKPLRAQALLELVAAFGQKKKAAPKETKAVAKNKKKADCLDFGVLAELAKYGGKALIEESLGEFEVEAALQIQDCEVAYQAQDFAQMQQILHTLKGNAGTLGLPQVASAASRLEQRLKAQKPLAPAMLKALRKAFEDFRKHYVKALADFFG